MRFLPIAELLPELLAADFSRPVACDNLNRVIASFHVHTSKIKKDRFGLVCYPLRSFCSTSYRILATRTEQAAIQHTKK